MRVFSKFPENNKCVKNETNILMITCTMVLYKYMKSHRNDSHDLSDNAYVRTRIYWDVIISNHCNFHSITIK